MISFIKQAIFKKIKVAKKNSSITGGSVKIYNQEIYKNYGFSSVDKVICKNKSNEIIELNQLA